MFLSFLNLVFFCQLALGSIHRRVAPLPPAQDPFYRATAGFENAAPGTILASRPAPARLELLNLIPINIKEVVQLLYRTTNALGKYFRSNAQMGLHGVPSMPLFVYKAVADEISPIADTDALVDQFCNDGVTITYVRDAAGEHFTQAATSFPDVINFLRARFAGAPISGCSRRNEFLDTLDPGALPYFDATIINELLNILGEPVGPHHF